MSSEYKLITEQVGLWGAVALLVGTAVGMSIFIVPTQMLAEAGPSITVAILVSVVPMILGVLGLLQLGGAIPVAGGAYVYASRLIGPYFGMLGVFIPVLAIWAYLLFAALGFAEYMQFFAIQFADTTFGGVGVVAVVWLLLGGFLVLNYFGIQMVAKVQLTLVGLLLVGLVTFVVVGALELDTANYANLFPAEGTSADGNPAPFADGSLAPFILAVVTLYIPFQGFTMIVEIGEELKNPIKNIPRVLAVGMTIVAVLSIAVVFVLAGVLPWQDATTVVEDGGGLSLALVEYTDGAPVWAGVVVALAALIGAATTINTLVTSYSRTVMRAGRDDVVPPAFAELHGDHRTPYRAILLLGVPPLLFAPFAVYLDGIFAVDMLDWLVAVVVTGIFIVFTFIGVAIWRLPKIFPARYEHSFYRLPMPVLKAVAVGNSVVSAGLAMLVGLSQPSALALVLAWMVLAYAVYRYRLSTYAGEGSLKDRMESLDSHE
jgi:APA family basic amino acid/polyamine antiporter